VAIVPPFREVVYFAHELLDTLTIYRATQAKVDLVENYTGISRSKIVWGLAIGCNDSDDFEFEDVPIEDARAAAQAVKAGGYAGVTTWSLNRDTDHRVEQVPGRCTKYQTGQEDGNFIRAISQNL